MDEEGAFVVPVPRKFFSPSKCQTWLVVSAPATTTADKRTLHTGAAMVCSAMASLPPDLLGVILVFLFEAWPGATACARVSRTLQAAANEARACVPVWWTGARSPLRLPAAVDKPVLPAGLMPNGVVPGATIEDIQHVVQTSGWLTNFSILLILVASLASGTSMTWASAATSFIVPLEGGGRTMVVDPQIITLAVLNGGGAAYAAKHTIFSSAEFISELLAVEELFLRR
jgi:hypothetical protein